MKSRARKFSEHLGAIVVVGAIALSIVAVFKAESLGSGAGEAIVAPPAAAAAE